MKRWLTYGMVLLSAGILVACSPKKDNTDVSDELKALRKSITTTVATSTTTSVTSIASNQIFVKELIGTWYGVDIYSPGNFYNRTYHENGLVEEERSEGQYETSQVNRLVEVGDNLYRYEVEAQDTRGVFHGNIGGVGIKYVFGLYISPSGEYIEPVLFSALMEEEFDYSYTPVPSMRMYRDIETLRNEVGTSLKTEQKILVKDTKNLTTQEVTDWVWRNFSAGMEASGSSFYTDQGWSVDVWENRDDHLVYATILDENEEIIWEFRVNAEGHLQTNKGYGSGIEHEWQTVAEDFADNGKW